MKSQRILKGGDTTAAGRHLEQRRTHMARQRYGHASGRFMAVLAAMTLAILSPVDPAAGQAKKTETAVFGAGCFWCVEAFYEPQPGVVRVTSGYAGGSEANPTYKQVSAGRTSHAEVVLIEFDPTKTSYEKLVDFFWKTHDATDGSGVWPDFGKQYRSIILYKDEAQRQAIERSKARAQAGLSKPIATEISPLTKFWPAEDYHQDYVVNNPDDTYVVNIAKPKLKKLGLLK
jgi:peptide-methionine (S)-S-oxide reductase